MQIRCPHCHNPIDVVNDDPSGDVSCLTGHPIQARPVGRTERTWRWCHRNPTVASLSAVIVLVMMTVNAIVEFDWARDERRNDFVKSMWTCSCR